MSISRILKIAGGSVAWVIGSGFATGQEIMRFYSCFGLTSFFSILMSFVIFAVLAISFCELGRLKNQETNFQPYEFYCGCKIANVYSLLITGTMIMVNGLIVSGAGSTIHETYGFNKYIASAILSIAVLTAYLLGFQKMVGFVSKLSTLLIACTAFIAGYSTFTNLDSFARINEFAVLLEDKQSTYAWWVSGMLYPSLIMFPGARYFCELGKDCQNKKETYVGAFLGITFIMSTIFLINSSVLLNAEVVYNIDVPNVYLAKQISPFLGDAMAILLYLGMFSCCCTIMWTCCSEFYKDNPKANTIVAVVLSVGTFFMGLLPFGPMVGIVYPIMGICGLYFIFCVFRKAF